jgi:hypothetical protein
MADESDEEESDDIDELIARNRRPIEEVLADCNAGILASQQRAVPDDDLGSDPPNFDDGPAER